MRYSATGLAKKLRTTAKGASVQTKKIAAHTAATYQLLDTARTATRTSWPISRPDR